MADIEKKLSEIIRSNKCDKKGCLSNNQDNLEVVWFGSKFDKKEITCSSCILMNDLVVGRLEPVAQNILPISAFTKRFTEEYTQYIKLRNSKDWRPKLTEAKKDEIKKEMESFEKKLTSVLAGLVQSLKTLLNRVNEKSTTIFTVAQFEQIQRMNNEGNFEKLFGQIEILMKKLHRVGQQTHRFVEQESIKSANDKLKKTISEVSSKVNKTLTNLLKQIKIKSDEIQKI